MNETKAKVEAGLSCPKCGCKDLRVFYTRRRQNYILRVRYCRYCGRRILTRERAE